jgi:hypothetical protein
MSGIVSGARFGTALTVLGCLALAGCGGSTHSAAGSAPTQAASSAGGASAGSGNAAGAVFSGTITVTGSVTASGSWTDTNEAWPEGCKDWATNTRGDAAPLHVPGPGGPLNGNVSGHQIGIAFLLPHYAGPGSFTSGLGNTGIDADSHVYDSPAAYKLVINGDGSGSLTFSNAADPLNSSAVISGSETWTCH